MPKRTWTIENLKNIVKSSKTLTETINKLGLRTAGGNYKTIKLAIKKYNINIDHFDPYKSNRTIINTNLLPLEDLLVEKNKVKRSTIKKRLIKENILENKCSICGLPPFWNNEPLVLQLDHKNGIHNDYRLENLRLLCPNCHSQTKNYAGKNLKIQRKYSEKYKKCPSCNKNYISNNSKLCRSCYNISRRKVNRPSKEELSLLMKTSTWVYIGKKFGVSDNAVRKWAKQYGLI